jgi:predicted dinucleotide-binding enzyme
VTAETSRGVVAMRSSLARVHGAPLESTTTPPASSTRSAPARRGSRDPGSGITVTDVGSAIRTADLIVNATPGDTTLERMATLRADLAGRILLDVSNATVRTADGLPGGLLYPDGSLGERLQAALPETEVVKGLNTMLFSVMTDPAALRTPPTAFLSGDADSAKATVREVLRGLGWREEWILDLGPIATASGTEAVAVLIPSLLRTVGFVPFALSVAR